MTLRATDYVILRDVKASGLAKIPMERKPIRVATMVSHEKFEELDHQMIHWVTVFFEDKMHDWDWRDGQFRYYTRVAETADVLVVYAEEEVPPASSEVLRTNGEAAVIFWDPEKAKAIAEEGQRHLAELLNAPWACKTCKGRGMIGGPSFYQPDEGGVECPDCTPKEQGEML